MPTSRYSYLPSGDSELSFYGYLLSVRIRLRGFFDDAKATFVEWTDLNASLTDFTVASHMQALAVDHILTYDRHYDAFEVTTLPYRNHD